MTPIPAYGAGVRTFPEQDQVASGSGSPSNCDSTHANSLTKALLSTEYEVLDESEDNALDSGMGAWLVVLGGFLSFWTGYGILNSWGTFQAFYAAEWPDKSLANISWIGGLQTGLLYLLGGIIGPAFDRWGARPLMFLGAIIYSVSLILASFSSRIGHCLLTQGFSFGIGNALMFYPTVCSIMDWFDRKRGLAMGIAAAGSSLGGIFWPIIINDLLHVVGLAWTLRIIALISLPVLVAACMLIRTRKPKRSSKGPGSGSGSGSEWAKTLRMTLYKSEFLALASGLFFIYLGSLVPFNYIPLYAESSGATSATANILLAVSYTGSLIGRVGTTWAADWLGGFNMLAAASILSGISILCWIGMTATDVPSAFAYGLSSGGVLPLGVVCVTQLSPDMKHCGLRISMMMTLCSVGVLGVGPLTGLLLQSSAQLAKGYIAVFLLSGVATLFGGITLIVGRLVWTSRTRTMNEEDGHLRKIRRD